MISDFEEKLCKRIEFLCTQDEKDYPKTTPPKGQWDSKDIEHVDEFNIQAALAVATKFPNTEHPSDKTRIPLCWSKNTRRVFLCKETEKDKKKEEKKKALKKLKGDGKKQNLNQENLSAIDDFDFEKTIGSMTVQKVKKPCIETEDIRVLEKQDKDMPMNVDICFSSKQNEYNHLEIKYPRNNGYKWCCQNKKYNLVSKCNEEENFGKFDEKNLDFDLPMLKRGEEIYITSRREGSLIVDLVRLLNYTEDKKKGNNYFVAFFKSEEVEDPGKMINALSEFLKITKGEKIEGLLTKGKYNNIHFHEITEYREASLSYFKKDDNNFVLEPLDFEEDNSQIDFIAKPGNGNHLCAILLKVEPAQ